MSSASASARPVRAVRRSARKRKDPVPSAVPLPEQKNKGDADEEDDDEEDEGSSRPAKKQNTRHWDETKEKAQIDAGHQMMSCAWTYALCTEVPEGTFERDYLRRMYLAAAEKLVNEHDMRLVFKSIDGWTRIYRDMLKNSFTSSSDREDYKQRLKFMVALNADGRVPLFPGSTDRVVDKPVKFWDHRTDPEYKAPSQETFNAFMAVLYPVKRFTAGGMCGGGLNVLLNMPDGTMKEFEQGTPEYKQYWADWAKKRPFRPHAHHPVTGDAYLWGGTKKPEEYDDLDKELIAKHDPYKPSDHVLGLHTYGGYHMFFRPAFDEVIPLMIRAGVKIDDSIRRIYVTTEAFPTDRGRDCYDGELDRHRAITMWWILRK